MTSPSRIGPKLNWQLILPVVCGALFAIGLGMIVALAVAIGSDGEAIAAFAIPAAVLVPLSVLGILSGRRLGSMPLRARDGFFAVTAAWLAAALAGTAPLLIAGSFTDPISAFFESMSGISTTGATLLDDIEAQPDAVLIWRSLSQWLGGIGIVVLVIAIAPATGLASQRVFYAETTGATAERLTPRIADTAKILAGIYLAFSAIGLAAYLAAGMSPFDAVNHIMTTISTGGFSTRSASIAGFDSLAIELVALLFMMLGGINFAFYWRAMKGKGLWPQAAEVRMYLGIMALGIALVTATVLIAGSNGGLWESLRASAFSVVTVMTGTGYVTADFDSFADFARGILFLLMFVGGCAGSTSGGIKVIRIMLLGKTASQEVQRQLRPKAIQVLRIRGQVFSEEVRRGVLGFFYIYISVAVVGTLAMMVTGLDGLTAVSSVAATLNIVGPGLGEVGAAENYGAVSQGGRLILSFLMLAGRLEVFTVLVLLTPAFWRPSTA